MMEINRTNDQHSKNNNSYNTHRITEQRTISAKQTPPIPAETTAHMHTYIHTQACDTSWEINRYPVNMPDPIRRRSGLAGKQWPEAGRMILAHRLVPDRIRSAKTGHNQPELNRTRAGFAQYCPGRLWKNATESETGKLVAGRLSPARNRARWFLLTGCFLSGRVWPNPDQAIQMGPGSVLRNTIHAFFGKTELKRMREVGYG